MKLEEAKKLVCMFADGNRNKTLSKVAVKNGFAYASDGRLGVKVRVDGQCEDDVPESWPVKSLGDIIEGSFNPDPKWFRIGGDHLQEMVKKLVGKRNDLLRENERDMRDRYKEVICPECGSYLYYDKNEEKLVDEKEELDGVQFHEVKMETLLVFGEGGSRIPVGFGYVYEIMSRIESACGGILFAKQETDGKNGDIRKLLFKSEDGSVTGVLMPLRSLDDEFDNGFEKLVALPVEDKEA
jgi:hypothetical protein